MPALIVPGILAIGGLFAFGYAADKVGEGAKDTSNAALKVAITGAVGFIVLKKLKVI